MKGRRPSSMSRSYQGIKSACLQKELEIKSARPWGTSEPACELHNKPNDPNNPNKLNKPNNIMILIMLKKLIIIITLVN